MGTKSWFVGVANLVVGKLYLCCMHLYPHTACSIAIWWWLWSDLDSYAHSVHKASTMLKCHQAEKEPR